MEFKEDQILKFNYSDRNVDETGQEYKNIREYEILNVTENEVHLQFNGFVVNENPYLNEKNIKKEEWMTPEKLKRIVKERLVK